MNSMENHFKVMSEVAGQDMMEVTMTMLDSYCPSIRTDLEPVLNPPAMANNPIPETAEGEETAMKDEMKERPKEEKEEVMAVMTDNPVNSSEVKKETEEMEKQELKHD